jgi:hypothetical protein
MTLPNICRLLPFVIAVSALAQYGPETCKPGFVWREACGPNDHICVPVATRTQAAQDNAAAASHRAGGGAFGPDTCKPGFVWREACGPQDHVCVAGATRTQAAQDNAQAAARFLNPPVLWDVLTQHNDPARSGAQLHETILTPANVRAATFGKLYERAIDGQVISQPLYESNQSFPGKGLKNVVYVVTRTNWIYAFDADNTDPDTTHGLIWKTAVPIEPAARPNPMCGETVGPVGVTSTPVIDRVSDTMYVTARRSDGSIWLHAIDLATGAAKAGTPGGVKIAASVKNAAGHDVVFQQSLELQRAGLLFQDGAIYMAFSALDCDNPGWHGWLLAYRAPDLQQVGAFVTTQSDGSGGAGIWQSGQGLVGDGANVYFQTGNGTVNGNQDLGESFVKLRCGPHPLYGLSYAGSYTVSNFNALNNGDTDLGSGGPFLLPGNRLAGGGKQGKLYVMDTASMHLTQNASPSGSTPPGGGDGFQAFINSWHDDSALPACTNILINRHCFMAHTGYEDDEITGPNIHSGPVYWDAANPSYGMLYGMPEKDYLRAFRVDRATHQIETAAMKVGALRSPDGMPGSPLSFSANGSNGGIVWASVPKGDGQWQLVPGMLVAFDALTLQEIWRDDDNIAFPKFNPPTIAGGKVFRPTFANKLVVYGLRSSAAPAPCYNIAGKYQNYAGADGNLGASTSAESGAPDGVGRFQHFQGGSIYFTPSTCAHEVEGSIHAEWSAIGWEKSPLGYPVTDETTTPDGIGRYNHFQSGSVYWTPYTGAHEVHGSIRAQWSSMGWELSSLGYPLSDETDEVDGSGRFNVFEHGSIHWNAKTSAVTVKANPATLISAAHTGANRAGSDIANFDLPSANPAMCQQSCADNAACRAWTYVNPGVQNAHARCWLKNTAPVETADACCTSGIKVDVHPANTSVLAGHVDRPGSDFANFDLPSDDYRLCQGECALNGTCKAWTYTEPANNKPGHCFLKSSIPPPNQNGCCVSGAK